MRAGVQAEGSPPAVMGPSPLADGVVPLAEKRTTASGAQDHRTRRFRFFVFGGSLVHMTNPLEPTPLGNGKHALIGEMLEAGIRTPSTAETLAWAARKAAEQTLPVTTRMALRTRYATAVVRFFGHCCPPTEWTFLGREIDVPGGRIDFLWETDDGRLVGQEIKTGDLLDPINDDLVATQVASQVAGAAVSLGERFAGILVHHLAAPSRAFFVDRNLNHQHIEGATCPSN
jgi:hypothetical protein